MGFPQSRNLAASVAGALDFTDLSGTVLAAQIANDAVEAAKVNFFLSEEQTGDGNPQNIAHGLGAVPGLVLVIPTEMPDAALDIAEGSHDDTNVVVTATASLKYKVLAIK